MSTRMCDGQPREPCHSNCWIDCHFQTAECAHTRPAEQHYVIDVLPVVMFHAKKSTRRQILALDWLLNLPYRLNRWSDR